MRSPAGDIDSESADDDPDLIARARAGEREAFDRLVERHLTRVWHVVWRIVRQREDAEDVTQEVFVSAYRALGGYRGEARFSTWLHRIAVTRALNHLDRKEEKMSRSRRDLEDLEAGPGPRGVDIPGAGARVPSPLQALESRELMRRLSRCLQRLPAPWRAILSLRDVDSRSYEEIARLAGIAVGTVRSRLARARTALRDCLTGEEA